MKTPPSLEHLARSARRSGWPIAVICGIAIPFSLTAPFALLCSVVGLVAGIEEIRRGGRLLQSGKPGAELRVLGWLQAAFTGALLVYFAHKTVIPLLGGDGAEIAGLDPDTAALLKTEAPELLQAAQTAALMSTLGVGVIAVGWQAWWSRRYFGPSARVGSARHVAPVVFHASLEEKAVLADVAKRLGVSEEEVVRQALQAYSGKQLERSDPPRLRDQPDRQG